MRCPTLLALLAGVMLYLVIGALVFRTLESPQESKEHEKLLRTTRDFLQNHSCVTAQNLSDLIMVHTHQSTHICAEKYTHTPEHTYLSREIDTHI
jgi:hypothetical protein